MDPRTLAAIRLHLARETYASALLAYVDGSGSQTDAEAEVKATLTMSQRILERAELAAARAYGDPIPSRYARNGR